MKTIYRVGKRFMNKIKPKEIKIIELNKSPALDILFPSLFESFMDYIVDYQFKPEKQIIKG